MFFLLGCNGLINIYFCQFIMFIGDGILYMNLMFNMWIYVVGNIYFLYKDLVCLFVCWNIHFYDAMRRVRIIRCDALEWLAHSSFTLNVAFALHSFEVLQCLPSNHRWKFYFYFFTLILRQGICIWLENILEIFY